MNRGCTLRKRFYVKGEIQFSFFGDYGTQHKYLTGTLQGPKAVQLRHGQQNKQRLTG